MCLLTSVRFLQKRVSGLRHAFDKLVCLSDLLFENSLLLYLVGIFLVLLFKFILPDLVKELESLVDDDEDVSENLVELEVNSLHLCIFNVTELIEISLHVISLGYVEIKRGLLDSDALLRLSLALPRLDRLFEPPDL